MDPTYQRMQVKVLYSFNDNPTVFLSRSRQQHSVKVVQLPAGENEDQVSTLGAFDLRSCVNQITKSSPENFNLQAEDYAVYYKDITEQPDEPFVGNGVLSSLMGSAKSHVVPGRVCQNLSASFLFGDKNSSSLTLEIRLKLHTIEKSQETSSLAKRENSFAEMSSSKRTKKSSHPPPSSSNVPAAKATRTKSLPIFYHPHNQQIHNIINADKSNAPSRYDSKSVQDRFKSAPFMQAKILDDPNALRKKKRGGDEPQRAMRTRSMLANTNGFNTTPGTTSPIQEEMYSDETDDTEYNDRTNAIEEGDEEEEEEAFDERSDHSPYTPQQPPYKPSNDHFESLPDFESLGKKTHTIPHSKLPQNHGLVCINENCSTVSSITWRYFEQKNHPPSLALLTAEKFDKSLYNGMFGPLCNACYLFLRTKGFMRPPAVVKKYLQQQRYKKEQRENSKSRSDSIGSAKGESSSSPFPRFVTPSHTPSMINQVIENNKNKKPVSNSNYDLNEFMNQLNAFGGPLTDIDPLPQDQGITPPMIATKSNTRVINLYDDEEDKENQPPSEDQDADSSQNREFERLIKKSFGSDKQSSPNSQWIDTLFVQPTPKDGDKPTPIDGPKMRTFTIRSSPHKAGNMPSSPLVKENVYDLDDELNQLVSDHQDYFDVSSPATKATRSNTTMSWNHAYRKQGSTPNTELYSDEKGSMEPMAEGMSHSNSA
ncbi:hypothetical protein JA9_001875 [Meyerozyma sp. JA9]|nr:hypothetical protein JA9_001875 [Meyerozyma sp. JA9]